METGLRNHPVVKIVTQLGVVESTKAKAKAKAKEMVAEGGIDNRAGARLNERSEPEG
ncbi:hypothetical protein GYB61_12840 [bacterium]|nr:hypothetical protein [bacterium]